MIELRLFYGRTKVSRDMKIARRLFISVDAVHDYLEAYQNEDGRLTPNHKGSEPILNKEESKKLAAHLENQVYTKVKDIQVYVQQTFQKHIALSTVLRWLKAKGFSYKKPVLRPKGVDVQKQEEFIKHYHQLMNEAAVNDDPVLFCDAVHPTQQTQASYGWFKRGKNKAIETTAGRKRLNLMGALNLHDMSLIKKSFETINGSATIEFFKEIERAYPKARTIHAVLDRAGYYTCREVEEHLKTSHIRIHFLPPRSPNLNPIERLWKIMHEYVSHNPVHAHFRDFKRALDIFFDQTMNSIKE